VNKHENKTNLINKPLNLSQLTVKGFKSFSDSGQTMNPGRLTVLLGANASGKSNLVSFFKMLDYILNGKLQLYVGEHGTAESLLYYGPKHTKSISATLNFNNMFEYSFSLNHGAGDTLVFNKEYLKVYNQDNQTSNIDLKPDIKESGFQNHCETFDNRKNKQLFDHLSNIKVFQFHDTTSESKIRNKVYINDCKYLHHNGGNLSAFLFAMKQTPERKKYYDRIIRYIKQVVPKFRNFELEPFMMNNEYIQLNWKETESNYIFGPHQLSDGSLRYIALASLLLQPPDTSPSFIIIDEPELGLHPSAISSFAGMVKSASQHKQILLATQSTNLIDEFQPDQILIVDRHQEKRCSEFKRLNEKKLKRMD
jgi:predicted ATPase